MYKNFYRVRVWTLRKEFEVYVEALTKNEAVGVAYMDIAEKYGRHMFVKIVSIEEIKPE